VHTSSTQRLAPSTIDHFLAKQLDSLHLPGLSIAIINRGKIVYHRVLGVTNVATQTPVDMHSLFEAASLSKTAFTYLVLRLVDQGVLTLDTPLYHYLPYPDLAYDERYKLITARMVLSHTTGLPNWRTSERADSSRQLPAGALFLKFTPGTRFSYSGEGYYYLAQVLAKRTNRTLQTLDGLFQQEVARPLHLPYAWFSSNAFISQHKVTGHLNGQPLKRWPASLPGQDSTWFGAAGGLHTEAVSYARLLIALMKGQGLTKASAHELVTAQVSLPVDADGVTAWGLGVAIRPTADGTNYLHSGNNGNFQAFYSFTPSHKRGYVFFTNCDKGAIFNDRLATFFVTGK
jgi:CubicO group peptidase (beta-lactamase class C family)